MGNEKSNLEKTKADLDNEFSFFGNFYTDGAYNYRNVLVIIKNEEKNKETFNFKDLKYDALFVMMNPGGSKPKDKKYKKDDLFVGFDGQVDGLTKMIRTNPDLTQYQLARIALQKDWNSVCVLNLSDYANGKSDDFIKYLNENLLDDTNSIFNDKRNTELGAILTHLKTINETGNNVIFAAWGSKTHSKFTALVDMVNAKLNSLNFKVIGLRNNKHPDKLLFKHPLPRTKGEPEKWLVDFFKLIENE